MKSNSRWIAFTLTAFVMPGMGHYFLKRKLRGTFFMIFTLFLLVAGIFRYMSVLFALANIRGVSRPPHFAPFQLMREAWQMDHRILGGFLIAVGLIWILAILDVLNLTKKRDGL